MKKLLFTSVFIFVSFFNFSQTTGKIQGVVTYKTSITASSHPDIGAQVYFNKIKKSDTVNKVLREMGYYNLLVTMKEKYIKYSREEEKKEYQLQKDSLNIYTKKSYDYLAKIKKNEDLPILSIDGNGNYSFDLPVGKYEVIVDSEGKRNEIKYEIIEIIQGKSKVVNFEFDL